MMLREILRLVLLRVASTSTTFSDIYIYILYIIYNCGPMLEELLVNFDRIRWITEL